MKYKKCIPYLATLLVFLFSFGSIFAFAESSAAPNDIYYLAGGNGIVKVNEEQYNEVTQGKISLSNIVVRDNLKIESKVQSSSEIFGKVNNINTAPSLVKTTGYWTITSNTIGAGGKTNYYKPDGSYMYVNTDEYINLYVTPTSSAELYVGYAGTSANEYRIDVGRGQTAHVAFIDSIKVPGSYYTFVRNPDIVPVTLSGSMSVSKR